MTQGASPAAETLPARDLRGYGRTSAVRKGDRIALTCESPEKALLWAARYDHVYAPWRVRPGLYRLPGGGWTRLAVSGARMGIEYSPEEPKAQLDATLPSVPMFLNEYDDYAFRFYYREGATPPHPDFKYGTPWKQYDPTGEFDFAKQSADAGLIFWQNAHHCETAKGLDRRRQWLWAKGLADARALPVVINTNLGVPFWAIDAHREDMARRMDGFVGSYHSIGEPGHAGGNFISWAALGGARQEVLDVLARSFAECDSENVVNLLEPHGELGHGPYTVFLESGPVVDRSFRSMLRRKYGADVAAVARRWEEPGIRHWSDVRLPDVCEFAGYDGNAVDLTGEWEIRDAGTTNAWGRVLRMPGHDVGLFLPKRPREMRRRFQMPAAKAGERTWLYVWDLSMDCGSRVTAALNGRKVMDDGVRHHYNHWAVAEVTGAVRAGENEILVEVPHGKLCYKAYLTHRAPASYPYFGRGRNAKWADFCAWQGESRCLAVRRGLETLRAAEPDKTIVAMAPASYFNGMRELAAEFGTRFHDTGGMAAYWWDLLPALMRSKGLPFSLEPGGPAKTAEGFRRMTNFYLSEGVNAIHYFIHIGDVFWKPEIRAEFERRLPALKMMGRRTQPDNEIATLNDSSLSHLLGYPWGGDPAAAYPGGHDAWRFSANLARHFQMDAITPVDFATGEASRYRFVLDANNTVMTAETVAGVRRYVEDGGTFVAMFESGRHAPETPDRWLLHELAGVRLARLSKYEMVPDAGGVPRVRLTDGKRGVALVKDVPDCPVTTDGFDFREQTKADGIALTPVAPDVRVIWRWEDGTAAVTVRPVGKGRMVVFGLRPDHPYRTQESEALGATLVGLGAKEDVLDATCGRFGRHFVTTDGLYDVWYADTDGRVGPYSLRFRDGRAREVTDVLTGRPLPLDGVLGTNDFVMGTSPRGENGEAAWRWVKNQFGWWRGGGHAGRAQTARQPRAYPDVLDMSSMLGGAMPGPDYAVEGEFTVPTGWTDGAIELWAVGMYAGGFTRGALSAEIDGRCVVTNSRSGVTGLRLGLRAGQRFRCRLSVKGDENPSVHGFRGPAYLFYRPNRATLLDLSGTWQAYATPDDPAPREVALPGKVSKCAMLRRTFSLPSPPAGRRVRLTFASGSHDWSGGVIVNGRYMRRHHHGFGSRTDMDVTPWLKAGENEIILVHMMQSDRFDIAEIRLESGN